MADCTYVLYSRAEKTPINDSDGSDATLEDLAHRNTSRLFSRNSISGTHRDRAFTQWAVIITRNKQACQKIQSEKRKTKSHIFRRVHQVFMNMYG